MKLLNSLKDKFKNIKGKIKIKKTLLIYIILASVLLISGTLAWLTWRSYKTSLVLTVGESNSMSVILTPYQIDMEISPVITYEELEKYTTVKAQNKNASPSEFYLYYKINQIDNELKTQYFKYTILKSTDNQTFTFYKEGNFSNANTDNDFDILTESINGNTNLYYRVYIWLDGSNGSQNEIQGKRFNAELRANITKVSIIFNPNGGIMSEKVSNFDYTGSEQTYTVSEDGYYLLETWGAQGGYAMCNNKLYPEDSGCAIGGYSGYSTGEIYLTASDKLYVYVGGKGEDGKKLANASGGFNGGGLGTSDGSDDEGAGGGGGATHIATRNGLLSTLSSYRSNILIVAGGGGGASWGYAPGHGGGFSGSNGNSGIGGNQTTGYSFGVGQNASGAANSDGVGGGGGGFYGGFMSNTSNASSGGGGSGYIGNTSLTDKHMYCYNCQTSTDANTYTLSNGTSSCHSSVATADCAKEGNGYAKITYIGNTRTPGTNIGTLPTPTKTGYTFAGWYTEENGGTKITSSTKVPSESTTYYAHWTPNNYTITLNANGGSIPTTSGWTISDQTATKQIPYNSAYGTLPTPTKSGYIFVGWYTATSGGTKITSSSTFNVAGNQTLYAHWTPNNYTITLNANGGSIPTTSGWTISDQTATKQIPYNSAYGTLPTPTKSGYIFVGWYTATSGGTKITSSSTFNVASNQTLYAHWTVAQKSFDYTGGEQTYTVPITGTYKLEVWGAAGATSGGIGGYGGYSVGNINLTENTKLYINVGGQGNVTNGGYNGGGNGGSWSSSGSSYTNGAGGGGATHITKLSSGVLSILSSKINDILIVSGGGGGGAYISGNYLGGSGGGISGVSGTGRSLSPTGGTQNSGYSFGQGQNGISANGSSWGESGRGGGGGGYYGGTSSQTQSNGIAGGGGGSGYIGNTSLTDKHMYCYNCTTSSDTATKTNTGTCHNSVATADCAKEGNGYAKITYIGS